VAKKTTTDIEELKIQLAEKSNALQKALDDKADLEKRFEDFKNEIALEIENYKAKKTIVVSADNVFEWENEQYKINRNQFTVVGHGKISAAEIIANPANFKSLIEMLLKNNSSLLTKIS